MKVLRLVLLAVLVLTAFAVSPFHAQAVDSSAITCEGDLVLTISFTPIGTVWYRVEGTGPGLPTSPEPVVADVPVTLTWTVSGPGSWSGLLFAGDGGSSGGWWGPSSFDSLVTAECAAVVSEPLPGPGPDMVPIPETAVVGKFIAPAVLLYEPRPDALTEHAMDTGQSLWVIGLDASGAYYQVLLSGGFYWVPVETMGPNYDETWGGRPLPADVVE